MRSLTDVDGIDAPFERAMGEAMKDDARRLMPVTAKVRCVHPNCRGAARFQSKQGGVEWYQCRECGFSFAKDDARRRTR